MAVTTEQKAEFDSLGRAVAAQLPGWVYEAEHGDWQLRGLISQHQAKAVIVIGPDHTFGRLQIRGRYPVRDSRGEAQDHVGRILGRDGKRPVITVALKRGSLTIAKEIKRRFLPDYLNLLADVRVLRLEHEQWLSEQNAQREELLAALGDCGELPHNDRDVVTVRLKNPCKAYGEFSAYGDTANVKLSSVPWATALKIAQVLRESVPQKETPADRD